MSEAAGWTHDAELRNWEAELWPSGWRIAGRIYADKKGRFKDGERVITTTAQRLENGRLTTKNTRYLLVNQ